MTDVDQQETVWSRTQEAIRTYGWVQSLLGSPLDGMCLVGGLLYVTGHTKRTIVNTEIPDSGFLYEIGHGEHGSSEFRRLLDKLAEVIGQCGCGHSLHRPDQAPIHWNDMEGRTKEEVLNLLQEMHEKELAERGELA